MGNVSGHNQMPNKTQQWNVSGRKANDGRTQKERFRVKKDIWRDFAPNFLQSFFCISMISKCFP